MPGPRGVAGSDAIHLVAGAIVVPGMAFATSTKYYKADPDIGLRSNSPSKTKEDE